MSEIDSLPNRPLTESEAEILVKIDSVERIAVAGSPSPIISLQRGEFAGSITKVWIDWGEEIQALTWEPGKGGGWQTPGKFPVGAAEKPQFQDGTEYEVIQ